MLHCVSCRIETLLYWVPVLELLKIFAQNLHIYHRNDSTSACIIHFMYILVMEDVIGSDVWGGIFWAHTVLLFRAVISVVVSVFFLRCGRP